MDEVKETPVKVGETPKEKVGYFRSTERNLQEYQEIFSFTPGDFKQNARILDVGSGTYQAFAKKLRNMRPDLDVVSIDPSLFIADYEIQDETGKIRPITRGEKTERRLKKSSQVIAAMAPDLPFKNDSFDYIFDNHGAFMYFPNDPKELKNYLGELLRITRPDSQINIYPLDLYIEALIEDPNERFNISKNRISGLVGEIGIQNFQLFTSLEQTRNGPIPRLGIKIVKK
ncbi:MAG: class I SAM-dependent methyltransferase [Candidatus Daviesbacteria bacterium]|nr:class I SAM-dependent methyltransferase [Candidatus Daviesbacteria bacterium]